MEMFKLRGQSRCTARCSANFSYARLARGSLEAGDAGCNAESVPGGSDSPTVRQSHVVQGDGGKEGEQVP